MPAAIPLAVAGVAAVGSIASAKMQSNANKRATDAQMRANDQAMSYQERKDAERKAMRDQAYADYQRRDAEWVRQYGGGGAAVGPNPWKVTPGGTPGVLPPINGQQGTPLAELVGPAAAPEVNASPAGVAPQRDGTSLADLARWSDHNQYFQA